uniref:Uncharacterized protein n=1 Tax=Myotis myotis TaxID=51298 RepID=A0A7J8ALP8_MYOMY|nr:hypothetical protein mMyoMyo1_007813 [Myotis myotis]
MRCAQTAVYHGRRRWLQGGPSPGHLAFPARGSPSAWAAAREAAGTGQSGSLMQKSTSVLRQSSHFMCSHFSGHWSSHIVHFPNVNFLLKYHTEMGKNLNGQLRKAHTEPNLRRGLSVAQQQPYPHHVSMNYM